MIAYTTKVVQSGKRSENLRTSIPHPIAHLLEVRANDVLEWVLEFGDGPTGVMVRKRDADKKKPPNIPKITPQQHETTGTIGSFEE